MNLAVAICNNSIAHCNKLIIYEIRLYDFDLLHSMKLTVTYQLICIQLLFS